MTTPLSQTCSGSRFPVLTCSMILCARVSQTTPEGISGGKSSSNSPLLR
jgi:hypothetical protein